MKEIEHGPKESRRRYKFPEHDKWVQKEYPNGATPGDLVRWLLPIAIMMTGMFLYRNGWPF